MKYFNNPMTGDVHAYDDDVSAHYISDFLILMLDAEVQAYIASAAAPLPAKEDDERKWRDAELSAVMWLRERHRDQLEIEAATSIDGEQFRELLVYMQDLRDWPQSPEFPDSQHRPKAPAWIASQAQ